MIPPKTHPPLSPAMSGGASASATALRENPARAVEALCHPSSQTLVFVNGQVAVKEGDVFKASLSTELRLAAQDPLILLGPLSEDPDGPALYALALSEQDWRAWRLRWSGAELADLRATAADLPITATSTAAQAKAVLAWHATHRFCSCCGALTRQAQWGWRRDCDCCGSRHFPRTDPVVIMLITRMFSDGEERVVLGRQKNWPPGRMSILAGFVEPGETVENAVRRETMEEAGVPIGAVRYLVSQPWPFPACLMLGCQAEALSETLEPNFDELEDCRWASKAQMRASLEGREDAEFSHPNRSSIAYTLSKAWAYDQLA